MAIISESLPYNDPKLYTYLQDFMDEPHMMYALFSSYLLGVFVIRLQDKNPEVLTSIFDAFLLMGKSVTFSIFFSCFDKMQDTIMNVPEEQLM